MDDDCEFSVNVEDYHCHLCMAMEMVKHGIEHHENTLVISIQNIIETLPMPEAINLLGDLMAVHYNPEYHEMIPGRNADDAE